MKKFLMCTVAGFFIFLTQISSAIEIKDVCKDEIFDYSKITDSSLATNSSGAFVWIQDLHKDATVQKNIYNTIALLSQNKNIGNIYLEGLSDGEVLDVTFLKNIPNVNLKNATIKNLLDTGALSGAEYYALLGGNAKIVGIEDKNVYLKNLQNLNVINNEKILNSYISDQIISFCNEVKRNYLTDNIINLRNIKVTDLNISDEYPNVRKQQQIIELINKTDVSSLNKKFADFIVDFNKVAGTQKTEELSKYLKKNTPYGYKKCYDIVAGDETLNKKYSSIISFFKINSELFEINPIQLAQEYDAIKKQNSIYENVAEQEFSDLEYFAELLKNFATAEITSDKYIELKNKKYYASYLFRKYLPQYLQNFALYYLNNETFKDFCKNNILRNDIFVKNLLKNSDDNKINVIIAGGFHTAIIDKLKSLNKSYVVLTPNFAAGAAFNTLFSTSFTTGTNLQKAEVAMSIIEKWGAMFSNAQDFQKNIALWFSEVTVLKDFKADVSEYDGNFQITLSFPQDKQGENGITSLISNISSSAQNRDKLNSDVKSSSYLTSYTLETIMELASQPSYFGGNISVFAVKDNSLIDDSLILPVSVETKDGVKIININEKFLNALSVEDSSVTETFVGLLMYLSSASSSQAKDFAEFFEKNKENISRIYAIKNELTKNKSTISAIKKFFTFKFGKNVKIVKEQNIELAQKNENATKMLEAIRQAELARQTRSRLVALIQPPVGAYMTDSNGITGRNFNRTDSVLHAETLTFIDYLRNYILANETTSNGTMSPKGEFLLTLLDMAIENGSQLGNKFFFNNKSIFEFLGINIEYDQDGHIVKCDKFDDLNITIKETPQRTNDDVFNETNLIINFINLQLGKPLSDCSLYCTLAPCNKCVSTMVAAGIGSLYYASSSRNSYHNSQEKLEENGVKIGEQLLAEETDGYLDGYTRMNSSKSKTRLASLIQSTRTKYRALRNKIDTIFQKDLADKVKNIQLRTMLDLRESIDWTSITKDTDLSKLEDFLAGTEAWSDVTKRAGIIYILSHKEIDMKVTDNGIHFYINGKMIPGIYINNEGKVETTEVFKQKMEQLAKVRNVADMDDNLATRREKFVPEMQKVLNNLILYGIATPIIVTGNTLQQTRDARFSSLGATTPKLISLFFTEHGAIEYQNVSDHSKPLKETFVHVPEYIIHRSKAIIDINIINELEEFFRPDITSWSQLLMEFLEVVKIAVQGDVKQIKNVEYEKIIELFQSKGRLDTLIPFLNKLGYKENLQEFTEKWKNLNREDSKSMLEEIYSKMKKQPNFNREMFAEIMLQLSIFEMARAFCIDTIKGSTDDKEKVSLQKTVEKYIKTGDKPKIYERDDMETHDVINDKGERVIGSTRFIISPMSPTLVREIYAKQYQYVAEKYDSEKYGNIKLEVVSSGQTTINIQKVGITKTISLKYIIEQLQGDDTVIYSGDDFKDTGVDFPVYIMGDESNVVVINSDSEEHQKDKVFEGRKPLISLIAIDGFSDSKSNLDNITRSIRLQNMILSIVERNIKGIVEDFDATFTPENVAQELDRELRKPTVEVIDVNDVDVVDTSALLRAG